MGGGNQCRHNPQRKPLSLTGIQTWDDRAVHQIHCVTSGRQCWRQVSQYEAHSTDAGGEKRKTSWVNTVFWPLWEWRRSCDDCSWSYRDVFWHFISSTLFIYILELCGEELRRTFIATEEKKNKGGDTVAQWEMEWENCRMWLCVLLWGRLPWQSAAGSSRSGVTHQLHQSFRGQSTSPPTLLSFCCVSISADVNGAAASIVREQITPINVPFCCSSSSSLLISKATSFQRTNTLSERFSINLFWDTEKVV